MNAGGAAYTDGASKVWSADTGFNTGNVGSPNKLITGTNDQTLFANNRYDLGAAPELMYSFAVPNGDYTVRLYFAETYAPLYSIGKRVFDVKLEGNVVWADLDVFAEAGAQTMLIKENMVTINGQRTIVSNILNNINPYKPRSENLLPFFRKITLVRLERLPRYEC